MDVFVATKNAGKLAELQTIFAGSVLDLATYGAYADPAEGESSYADNARLKARALSDQLRAAGIAAATLADDSGLEVAALDGRPGVLSARYGGADATWESRRSGILAELETQNRPSRDAKFCCAMALIAADGREYAGYGEARGSIAPAERGVFGFGYDPIFIDAKLAVTFAEMNDAVKNRISHRAHAAQSLLANLTRDA